MSLVLHALSMIFSKDWISCQPELTNVSFLVIFMIRRYECYSPSNHCFYVAVDVTFIEDTPYFSE